VAEPLDVVYTWVDDAFPGYLELRDRYARSGHDRNPNRTRDNLDMLRFSLRSLAHLEAPVRYVYLVTCRPQLPPWLDPAAPGLRVVHHDEFMDRAALPTFNSFAIVASLVGLPGLTDRFLYVEDDHLFGRRTTLADFEEPDGRLRLWTKLERSPDRARRAAPDTSPWNLAVAHCNDLLDRQYRPEPRRAVRHGPKLIDRRLWQSMAATWPDELARTLASRFRAGDNVAPEYLYPYFAWYEGRARRVPIARSYVDGYYQGIDNVWPQQWLQLRYLRWLRPKLYCLNDNFGDRPSRRVVGWVRAYLEAAYPSRSRFER
jgi:hypothetical protein